MCRFMSGIVLRNGDVLCDPERTDSHSDLIAWHGLPDNRDCRHFAKVEFTPGDDILDVDSWTLTVDEETEPGWWGEVRERVDDMLRAKGRAMIVTNERPILLGGCWIVAGEANILKVVGSRIVAVGGSATIRNVGGSAAIRNVGDSAAIRNVGDSATIRGVGGSATISGVWGSATIRNVGGSATISDVGPSVRIEGDRRTKPASAGGEG